MSNYHGAARTNYVTVIHEAGLAAFLEGSGIVCQPGSGANEGKTVFLPPYLSEEGLFPSWVEDDSMPDGEREFDWHDVMAFIKVGEVLVVIQCGHEKLRYIGGWAQAFIRRESGSVEEVDVHLSTIYALASNTFQVPRAVITAAEN